MSEHLLRRQSCGFATLQKVLKVNFRGLRVPLNDSQVLKIDGDKVKPVEGIFLLT